MAMAAIFVLGISSAALGFEGGGRSPSQAPTIAVGQHYIGQLNNHKDDSNYGGEYEVAFWRLPPVSTRDVVTVDWHSVPYTDSPGSYPLCMSLVQGIDDFSWGSRFHSYFECGEGGFHRLSGSGTAHTEITVQESTTDNSYLEFFVSAHKTDADEYESFPYDFTVGPILHYLGLVMSPVKKVAGNGVVQATATLANGQPVPDGLPFGLTVTWQGGGIASFTGVSSGGVVSFQLNLPESAYGENAHFVAFHPADGNYQEVVAPRQTVRVVKPPPSACELAERRAHVLKRQLTRLKRHARRAHGANKRRLSRRAKRIKHQFTAAEREAAELCI